MVCAATLRPKTTWKLTEQERLRRRLRIPQKIRHVLEGDLHVINFYSTAVQTFDDATSKAICLFLAFVIDPVDILEVFLCTAIAILTWIVSPRYLRTCPYRMKAIYTKSLNECVPR